MVSFRETTSQSTRRHSDCRRSNDSIPGVQDASMIFILKAIHKSSINDKSSLAETRAEMAPLSGAHFWNTVSVLDHWWTVFQLDKH
jgi:hypothetical protein